MKSPTSSSIPFARSEFHSDGNTLCIVLGGIPLGGIPLGGIVLGGIRLLAFAALTNSATNKGSVVQGLGIL